MKNIYALADSLPLPWFSLQLADFLVSGYIGSGGESGAEENADQLMRLLIVHMAVQAGRGHIRSDLACLKDEFAAWFLVEGAAPQGFDPEIPARLAEELDALVLIAERKGLIARLAGAGAVADSLPLPRAPLCLSSDGRFLYFLRRRRAEDVFLAHLDKRTSVTHLGNFPELGSPVENETAGELMKSLAAGKGLILLTGGPGTGKTTAIAGLVERVLAGRREARMSPPRILLAAPTGRAAARLGEGLPGLSSRTLHALLGLAPGRPPRRDRSNPIDVDLLIVDEASMVDLPTMNLLLDALPSCAPLVLVGDPEQLPSVEAGAILDDLISGEGGAVGSSSPLDGSILRLHKVYRSDLAVLKAARAVRDGDVQGFAQACDGQDVRCLELGSGSQMVHKIAEIYRPIVSNIRSSGTGVSPEALKSYQAHAVLTPLRRGAWGVEDMNEQISWLLGKSDAPFAGMPIVVTENDSVRNLWNGSRGVLIPRDGRLRAVFPDSEGIREFPLAAMPGWEPAWTQTIHKSQGSEYDKVTILLPASAGGLLSREILYTAITRARNGVDLYLEENAIVAALARRVYRNSRVRDWAAGLRSEV